MAGGEGGEQQKEGSISWSEIGDCGGSEQEVFEIQLGPGCSQLAVGSW